MASASSLLCDEDQLLCSICLEVFNQPVTLYCGHNFCKACITQHCHGNSQYQCPMCKKLYNTGSESIHVNTLLSGLADQFRKSLATKDSIHPDQQCAEPAVPCDYCTGTKNKAVKSCLVCLASYCESHLEPHQRITGLKVHYLINPVESLEDRICKKHSRPLEMFCKTDEVCVCQFCCEPDHKLHVVVPLKEGYEGKKAEMEHTEAEVQMILERRLKILQFQRSVKLSKDDADREIADGVKVFTALRHSIDRSQAELISSVQDKQKSSEREAEGFIKELEQEIMGLTKRSSELKMLSHNEDLLHLLPSLSAPPPTRDLKKLSVCCPSHVGTVRRSLDHLEKTLSMEMKKLCVQAELERVQQDAVDVTLDGKTAHTELVLSDDGKEVHHGDIQYNLPKNPERFSFYVSVLGKKSFFYGRFYFEVDVKGKTRWRLGIVEESCNRKLSALCGPLSPKNGFWTLRKIGNEYAACAEPDVILSVTEKLQKVGVFLDYEEGLVSFYDVENRVHIYSFTGCTFTEPLYPLLNPGDNEGGENSVPLIITPVNPTD